MIRRILAWIGLFKNCSMPIKMLTVVAHTKISVGLHPIKVELCLCTDYYDSAWRPEDGAMFGRKHPGIALGWVIQALRDAENYAAENGYDKLKLVIKRVIIPGITESI